MANDNLETPKGFFNKIDEKYNFSLDPCCTSENAKCKKYYTKKDNGLKQSWEGERVFCNPPYSRGNIIKWLKKAYEEVEINGCELAVVLIPGNTATKYFHKYCMKAKELIFVKGRLKFGNYKGSPRFSSVLVVFEQFNNNVTKFTSPELSSINKN